MPRTGNARRWRRSSGSTRRSTRSSPRCACSRPTAAPVIALDLAATVDETVRELAPIFRRHRLTSTFSSRPLRRLRQCRPAPPAARLPARERVQVRAGRRARSTSTAGARRERAYVAITDDGPGIPRRVARAHLRAVRAPRRFAARRRHRAVRRPPPGPRDGRRPARRGPRAAREPVRAGAARGRLTRFASNPQARLTLAVVKFAGRHYKRITRRRTQAREVCPTNATCPD